MTIIGVVAALTIPTLMTKYQKHQYVVGLKKAYSQLQNAIKMVPLTEGCPAGDYDCAGMFDSTNIDGMNFGTDSFHPIYAKELYLLSKQFKVQKYLYRNSDEFDGFQTADGMIFEPYYISVDVNGQKGPNIWGRDKFVFYIADTDTNEHPKGTLIPMGSNRGWVDHCTTNIVNERYHIWEVDTCAGRVLEEDAMNY